MAQRGQPFQPEKHVCVYALERKGGAFTGEVVCTVCGIYLTSKNMGSEQDKRTLTPENQGPANS
jgi:hypothetical protein